MATSNREWAARGGWGVGAVSNFNALPSNRSLLDHANAIDGVRGGTYPLPGAVMMSAWRRPDGALVVSGSDGVDRVVGSQEIRTPEDADRLFGKGFGLGEWMRKNAGEARSLIHVCDPVAPANPTPAVSQVWAPPEGEPRPGWVDVDGTVTFAENHETPRDGRLCLTRGGTMDARDLAGWRCVGVATEHGRVMVGDGFALSDGHRIAVIEVAHHGVVECSHSGGLAPRMDAERLATEATRTRYATARVGERYRCRTSGRWIACVETGTPLNPGEHAVLAGTMVDPAQWERLDPSTASHAVAPVPQVPESDADLRARIVWVHRSGYTHSALLFGRVVAEIAATLPVMIMDVETCLGRVLGSPAHEWADLAMSACLLHACNPLTATGVALDRLAPLWSIERRGGKAPPNVRLSFGATGGDAVAKIANEAARAFTRIHDAAVAVGTRLTNPGGIPTASPEPTAEERVATAIADRRALDLGVPRREGEPLAAFARRCNAVEVRRAVDRCVTADHGPFATARAAALHAWAETLYSHDTVADVAAVHAGLLRYEALRGSRREPSLAAMDVGVPETARAMYERERGGTRVEAVTPPEEPARPTGGASLNGWQTAAHFWERWSR